MSMNPSDIRIFPFSFWPDTITEIIKRRESGLLGSSLKAVIVDSDQLIKDLCKPFLGGSRSNREILIPDIKDDLLMASIANGVGYILDSTMPQNNIIVSDLCNMDKISLLLSTFAIRNYPITEIREMYLSRVPLDNYNRPDLNQIAQIVNKVGGKQNMTCSIYVQSQNVDLVLKALRLTPEQYNANVDVDEGIVKGIAKDIFKAIFKK